MNRTRAAESASRQASRAPAASPAVKRRRLNESVGNAVRFFGSFLRRPNRVGSVLPSSAALARAMIRHCPLQDAAVVVELGPGTGALTAPMLEAIGPKTLFLAIELDSGHAKALASKFRKLKVVHGSAEELEGFLKAHGVENADCIVSGLPWGLMGADLQDRILQPVLRSLRPGGVFVAFGYAHARWMPGTRRFLKRLRRHFGRVETSRIVWKNLPPALIYRCSKPQRPAQQSPHKTEGRSPASP